jgi:hypothetical protein
VERHPSSSRFLIWRQCLLAGNVALGILVGVSLVDTGLCPAGAHLTNK